MKAKNHWDNISKKDYIWNLSISACECYKKCKIDEYLNSCTKHPVGNLLITCEGNPLNNTLINNSSGKKSYFMFFEFIADYHY